MWSILVAGALAITVPEEPIRYPTPDGSGFVEVRLRTDGVRVWGETLDGEPVVGRRVGAGVEWRPADVVSATAAPDLSRRWDAARAPTVDPRGPRPGPSVERRLPAPETLPPNLSTLGARHDHGLTVLVALEDGDAPTTTADQWQALLYAEDLDPTAHDLPPEYDLSLSDWFFEASHQTRRITGDVVGWTTPSERYSYYVSTYAREYEMVADVVARLDDTVDFSRYDNDGDGVVDYLAFVISGGMPGTNDRFWPHYWRPSADEWGELVVEADGVRVDRWVILPEVWEFDRVPIPRGQIHPISTAAHEFGHVLGLPDLYDTTSSNNQVGSWDIMGGGGWGWPTHPGVYSAWSAARLGFVDVVPAAGLPTVFELEPVHTSHQVLRVPINREGSEAYYLEHRAPTSIDPQFGTSGLLIWHARQDVLDWYPYSNAIQYGYGLRLLQADGEWDLENRREWDAGDLYPGLLDVTAIGPTTEPSTQRIDGMLGPVLFDQIALDDDVVRVRIGAVDPGVVTLAHDVEMGKVPVCLSQSGDCTVEQTVAVAFTMPTDGQVAAIRWYAFTDPPVRLGLWSGTPDQPGDLLAEIESTPDRFGWNTAWLEPDDGTAAPHLAFTEGEARFVTWTTTDPDRSLSADLFNPGHGTSFETTTGAFVASEHDWNLRLVVRPVSDGGCGCATGGSASFAWVPALALAWWRRRRFVAVAAALPAAAAAQDDPRWLFVGTFEHMGFGPNGPRWIAPPCELWTLYDEPEDLGCAFVDAAEFLPDGTFYVRGAFDGAMAVLLRAPDGATHRLPDAREVVIGPDGRAAYVTGAASLFVVGPDGSTTGPIVESEQPIAAMGSTVAGVQPVGFTDDGRLWFFVYGGLPERYGVFTTDGDGFTPELITRGSQAGLRLEAFSSLQVGDERVVVSGFTSPASTQRHAVVAGGAAPYVALRDGDPLPGQPGMTLRWYGSAWPDGDGAWLTVYDENGVAGIVRHDPGQALRTALWPVPHTHMVVSGPFAWLWEDRWTRIDLRDGTRQPGFGGNDVELNGVLGAVLSWSPTLAAGPDGSVLASLYAENSLGNVWGTAWWTDAPSEATRTAVEATVAASLIASERGEPLLRFDVALRNTGRTRLSQVSIRGLRLIADCSAVQDCLIASDVPPGAEIAAVLDVPAYSWDIEEFPYLLFGESAHGAAFDVSADFTFVPSNVVSALVLESSIADPDQPDHAWIVVTNFSPTDDAGATFTAEVGRGDVELVDAPEDVVCAPPTDGSLTCDIGPLAGFESRDWVVRARVDEATTLTARVTSSFGVESTSEVVVDAAGAGCGAGGGASALGLAALLGLRPPRSRRRLGGQR